MKTIFLFEWKKLIRTPFNILLLLFYISLGIYSIHYGNSVTKKQMLAIHDLENLYEEQVKTTIGYFNADTTITENKTSYHKAIQPIWIEHLVKPVATFRPNSFSSMAIGYRDVLPFYKEISTTDNSLHIYQTDISNPEILAAGNFDLSFVIIYLIPLLIIVFCHNIISEEKEQGTYTILKLQSNHLRKVLSYKLLFRFLLIIILTCILNTIAIYSAPSSTPVAILDFLCWQFVAICYLFFWFVICYVLISFQKNSVVTSLYMTGTWLLLSIIIPSLFIFYIDVLYPIGIKADMASEKRKIKESVWNLEPKVLIKKFRDHHPEYGLENPNDTLKYSAKHFVAYYEELENQLAPIAKIHKDKANKRKKLISRLSEFVPTLKVQKTLNQIGSTDFKSYTYVEESTFSFQEKWKKFIYHFIFNDKHVQVKDYLTMPKYALGNLQKPYKEILISVVELILLTLILIFLQRYLTLKPNKHLKFKK
ncbi:ABC-2 family transporter [Aquimarina sp. MAR_2010_214]|uniref:DUF3526 domain-containing protein n=1 Tax=Aquimarina sp. MAR_2010_214 TaxID=1250026 RepID=UPI000C706EF1|nr:DUF3526 domain-containing protein [Aquimarina sp. MAR_2010_214]PKV52592.1 ABC-2 family transporter [Aquimarina sp. MAR_2010_214]